MASGLVGIWTHCLDELVRRPPLSCEAYLEKGCNGRWLLKQNKSLYTLQQVLRLDQNTNWKYWNEKLTWEI